MARVAKDTDPKDFGEAMVWAHKMKDQRDRLREAVKTVVDSGSWYISALEIDHEYDGEELEKMLRAALEATKEDSP